MVTFPRVRSLVMTACCFLFSLGAFAGHRHGTEISTHRDGALRSCDDWQVRIDGARAVVSSETLAVASTSLELDAARNGGVSIRGGSGSGYSVTLCRAVSATLGSAGLSQIRVQRSGGRLSVEGPSGDDWAAFLIVIAPKGANLRASATNGPVDVTEFDGSLDLATTNGPLSLEKVSGTISAKTTNGPLTFDEGSGNVSLRATNGPLTVRLTGSAWIGQSFDAATVNGPLSLALPRGFSSGVELRSDEDAPWNCPEGLCGAIAKSSDDDDGDDEDRVVRFGGATPIVRIATENGPVSVRERD